MKKHKKRWYVLLALAILLLVGDIGFYIMGKYYPHVLNKGNTVLPQQSDAEVQIQQAVETQLKDISINSKYAILLDLDDCTPLYKKNIDQRIYPASITKIMSAVVTLDHIKDLNEKVTVEEKDLEGLTEANASVAGLEIGDSVTYEDLLYALILPSGADAANVIANHLFGNMDAFVEEMNIKAKAYGMTQTHFMNATGLHDDNHYTTIQDLERMMKHAWINTAFQQVLTTTKYEIPSTKLKLKSTLLLYGSSTITLEPDAKTETLPFNGGEIIGGKSGYTPEAECCLVSVAKLDNGHTFMFIGAKASGSPADDYNHIKDATHVYEEIAKALK